jgi:hypothetical protein
MKRRWILLILYCEFLSAGIEIERLSHRVFDLLNLIRCVRIEVLSDLET